MTSPAERAPDIVLVMTDEQRADWIGHASAGFFETPVLDRLGEDGVVFEHAYSSSTTCVPSRTSILTGVHHFRVPAVDGTIAMQEGVWTIARALREAGYETALVGRMHFSPIDADHGFDTVRSCENINPGSGYGDDDTDDFKRWMAEQGRPDWRVRDRGPGGTTVADLAGVPRVYPDDVDHHSTGWIQNETLTFLRSRRSEKPLFLVVSFPHPHAPYDPPEPYASRYAVDDVDVPTDGFEVNDFLMTAFGRSWSIYSEFATPKVRTDDAVGDDHFRRVLTSIRAMVRHIDDALGQIVAALDMDSTALFVTSDHGDYGGHRGLLTKVPWIPFEDLLRVPLIVSGGAIASRGRVVGEPVQTGSFAATVLDLAGVAPPDDDGDFPSLLPFLDGRSDPLPSDRPILASMVAGFPMARLGRFKVIRSWAVPDEILLFDLVDDPGETRSLHLDRAHRPVLDHAAEVLTTSLRRPAPKRFEVPIGVDA